MTLFGNLEETMIKYFKRIAINILGDILTPKPVGNSHLLGAIGLILIHDFYHTFSMQISIINFIIFICYK